MHCGQAVPAIDLLSRPSLSHNGLWYSNAARLQAWSLQHSLPAVAIPTCHRPLARPQARQYGPKAQEPEFTMEKVAVEVVLDVKEEPYVTSS